MFLIFSRGKPDKESVLFIFCYITNYLKTLQLKVKRVIYFAHESAAWAGVGRDAGVWDLGWNNSNSWGWSSWSWSSWGWPSLSFSLRPFHGT